MLEILSVVFRVIISLVVIILLLPFNIIIKNSSDGKLLLNFKILFFTFGNTKNKSSKQKNKRKKSSGASAIENFNIKKAFKEKNFGAAVEDLFGVLNVLFKELLLLLKHCSIKKLKLNVVCSSSDAAETAINYGKCCAVVYPFAGFITSAIKVSNKNAHINVSCDYNGTGNICVYYICVSVQIFYLMCAALKILFSAIKSGIIKKSV